MKTYKTILSIVTYSMMATCYANVIFNPESLKSPLEQSKKIAEKSALERCKKDDLPCPGSGLTIRRSLKSNNSSMMSELKDKGYIESTEPFIQTLIHRGTPDFTFTEPKLEDIGSTRLRKNLYDIKMSNKFSGVPITGREKIIGFAAGGVFEKNGWTDAVVFFTHDDLGTCKFESTHVIAERVGSDGLNYDINHKITKSYAKGSENHGFMYTVHWIYYKNPTIINYDLVCATIKFDKGHIDKMKEYARMIDNYIEKDRL